MSINKNTVRTVSDKADTCKFDQTNVSDQTYYNGELLGNFSPNNSINQIDTLGRTVKTSNVQLKLYIILLKYLLMEFIRQWY